MRVLGDFFALRPVFTFWGLRLIWYAYLTNTIIQAYIALEPVSQALAQRGVSHTWLGVGEALNGDRVLPAIAKIVEVPERLGADILKHVVEECLACVERAISAPVGIGLTPAYAPGADFVEVTVGPAHRGLNHKVPPVGHQCLNPSCCCGV